MNEPRTAENDWIECYFRPEADDCLLDLRFSDGSIIAAVRYSKGRLVGDEEGKIEFVQWRYHRVPADRN